MKKRLFYLGLVVVLLVVVFMVVSSYFPKNHNKPSNVKVGRDKFVEKQYVSNEIWDHDVQKNSKAEYPYNYKNYSGFKCLEGKDIDYNQLCQEAGGQIRNVVSGSGFGGPTNTMNCYLATKTSDGGLICKGDQDCQGKCVYLGGDMDTGDAYKCSDYFEPLFDLGDLALCPIPQAERADNVYENYKISDSADGESLREEYRQSVKDITRDYWLNGKYDGVYEKLSKLIAPFEYADVNFNLVSTFYYLQKEGDDNAQRSTYLNHLKGENPWIAD